MARTELTIAGVGGQGSILAGVILGTAAVTYDKQYAVQTQAYFSQLRGGFAAAQVVISDAAVMFPRVTNPKILVAQAQDSISRYGDAVQKDGILIIDSDMITTFPENVKQIYGVPATSIARNEIKTPLTANMVMLGALCRITEVVSRQALEQAVSGAVPKGKEQLNLDAFGMGYERVAAVQMIDTTEMEIV